MKRLPTACPSCHGELAVKQLRCERCETEVDGLYPLPALASLGQDGVSARSASLAQGGDAAKAAMTDQREKARTDLTATRNAAAGRLAAAVAALENLRLDLLRLKAGAGSLDELSANLTEARRLAGEMDAQVAGRIEAEQVLRGAT